ncbi:MAG: hypothetical protein V3U57_02405 [Robiginitomaculum sp.]
MSGIKISPSTLSADVIVAGFAVFGRGDQTTAYYAKNIAAIRGAAPLRRGRLRKRYRAINGQFRF